MSTTLPTPQGEIAQGLHLHQAGDLPGAARLYESVLARDPSDADAFCLLGLVHQAEGRHNEAIESIRRAVDLRPDQPAYHASLGMAMHAAGRPVEAAEALAKGLDLNPGDAASHVNRGVIVRSLGDREAALNHFRRAVELDPRLAQAQTNLGELLLEMGLPDQALPHCQAAAAIDPGLIEVHLNLAGVLMAMGRVIEATASYFQAYRLDETRARTAAGLGLASVRRGAIPESLPWFRRAVELEPRSVEYLRYLAEAAGTLRLYDEVRWCCDRILQINPNEPVAHNALGYILQLADRHHEARDHYTAAIRLHPEFSTARFNLGVLHEEIGELDEAEAQYRETLRIEPTNHTAMARLASLLRENLPDADLEELVRRISARQPIGQDQGNLLFALALVRDARGEYPQAAACLEPANALAREEIARLGQNYDMERHARFVRGLIENFTPPLFERLAGAGIETERPVFILGPPRSGTTLIEQVLASHPEIHGAGEIPLTRRSFDSIPIRLGRAEEAVNLVPDLDTEMVAELAREHEARLMEIDGGQARRIIGKMPENFFYLGLIAMMFPKATVIHCRRDLRDVALSCWFTNFTEAYWCYHQDQIARRLGEYVELMDHWKAVLPGDFAVHEVCYEEAVEDIEGTARRLLSAMGLDWHPGCLEFQRTRRPVKTASQVQVRRPVYRGSVGRWKLYEKEMAGFFEKVEAEAGMRSGRKSDR